MNEAVFELDDFPATLTREPDGTLMSSSCRVYYDPVQKVVYFFERAHIQSTDVILRDRRVVASAWIEPPLSRYKFDDGTAWAVRKSGNCGCGDPLKVFDVRSFVRNLAAQA